MLSVGDTLPDIAAIDDEGQPVRTGTFKGAPLVLWFYPKDDTPG